MHHPHDLADAEPAMVMKNKATAFEAVTIAAHKRQPSRLRAPSRWSELCLIESQFSLKGWPQFWCIEDSALPGINFSRWRGMDIEDISQTLQILFF